MADVDDVAERLLAALPAAAGGDSPSADDDDDEVVRKLDEWSDGLERALLTGGGGGGGGGEAATTTTAREAADALHRAVLDAVSPPSSGGGGGDWDDDGAADEATRAAAESLSARSSDDDVADDDGSKPRRLAALLRAAGLFLRRHSWSSSSSNPVASRLKSEGALLLYSKILDSSDAPAIADGPDVPRFASICIFRATYGDDEAIRSFVRSLDGCSYLAKALLKGGQPVDRLFSVTRNVHHLIAACPESIPEMERAIEALGGDDEDDEGDEGRRCRSLSEALAATLERAFRSDPPFPGFDPADRRPELALEVLRAMYALDNTGANPLASRPSKETMTTIGVVLCELLRLSSADERVRQIKLAATNLLLNAPEGYGTYLANNGGIRPLLEILSRQTSLVVVERTGRSSADDAAAVVPVLLALLKLAQTSEAALRSVREGVFPPSSEENFRRLASGELAKGVTEGRARAKNMAPLDAPRGTLRWKVIALMTNLDSNVKRSACELLWALCDGDATTFVLRTGFGNAVHFLGIRGCVNLPAGVDV